MYRCIVKYIVLVYVVSEIKQLITKTVTSSCEITSKRIQKLAEAAYFQINK